MRNASSALGRPPYVSARTPIRDKQVSLTDPFATEGSPPFQLLLTAQPGCPPAPTQYPIATLTSSQDTFTYISLDTPPCSHTSLPRAHPVSTATPSPD